MQAHIGLAFLAGLLSILSPCVLPLVPLVLGAAVSEHRYGAIALAAGLALSFTVTGLFVATVGFAIGLDADLVRTVAAVLLLVTGLVLMLPAAQVRLAVAAAPLGVWADRRFGNVPRSGLGGQFGVGLLLGALWSPCVGPTLGAASILAAESRDLASVGMTMAVFGLGAGLPLVVFGLMSRDVMRRWRGVMMRTGTGAKVAFGAVLVVSGLLTLSGLDKHIETVLVDSSPSWLTVVTTRF